MLNKTSLFGIIAATIAFIAVPAFAADTFLGGEDFVGITFWIVSIAMWASTIFFFYEGMRVSAKLENFNGSCRSNYIHRCSTLYVHERLLGCYR